MCLPKCCPCGWQQLGSCVLPAARKLLWPSCISKAVRPAWWQSGGSCWHKTVLLCVAACGCCPEFCCLPCSPYLCQYRVCHIQACFPWHAHERAVYFCRSLMQRVVSAVMWEGVTLFVVGLVLGICYGKRQCFCVARPPWCLMRGVPAGQGHYSVSLRDGRSPCSWHHPPEEQLI